MAQIDNVLLLQMGNLMVSGLILIYEFKRDRIVFDRIRGIVEDFKRETG